tara:strand:+ start:357 stop:746 length:390 start_codon:yes stop_codon:yes gene_type:complete
MLEYYTNLDNNNSRKNILKDEFTLDKSDYEKLKQAQQQNELNSLQYRENEKAKQIKENKNIYNMSLYSLYNRLSSVSINIIEDVTIYINQKDKNLNTFFIIFTKEDRLIYVGILLVIFSLSLWFIDISK